MPLALLAASLVLLGHRAAAAQARGEQPTPETPVVRISLEVVQVDAVVTDKAGRPGSWGRAASGTAPASRMR